MDKLLLVDKELMQIAERLADIFFADIVVGKGTITLERNEGDYLLTIASPGMMTINGTPTDVSGAEYAFRREMCE